MPRGRPSGDPVKLVRLALAAIDNQIAELQEKRAQLAAIVAVTRGPGRPPGRRGRPAGRPAGRPPGRPKKGAQKAGKRRKVSAATRRRLSEAAKQRWARERMTRGG